MNLSIKIAEQLSRHMYIYITYNFCPILHFFLKDPIYLQAVIIHSANSGKGEGWHVEEYSVALLC
jgi:hypothetical protein